MDNRGAASQELAHHTQTTRWKPEEIWMHRMAVRNRTTKAQLLTVIEKPGSLDKEDEHNAAKRKDAYTAMHEIGRAVGSHGAFVLKPELWTKLSPNYPYEHKDDREWIRNEIKRQTSQLSPQKSPTLDRLAQAPVTADPSSKRVFQDEEVGSNVKKQKTVGEMNFASLSGDESSGIQQASINYAALQEQPKNPQDRPPAKDDVNIDLDSLIEKVTSGDLTMKTVKQTLVTVKKCIASFTLSIAEKDQALEENRLALSEKSETIRQQSVAIRSDQDSLRQKDKMIQNLQATNAALNADVAKFNSDTQTHKQDIEAAIKDCDAARKEFADFKAAGIAFFTQK
ncbi:hypothetical protein ACEPPN_011755 [Leptodophora sp. 'Broadleaf-Isolate-01']